MTQAADLGGIANQLAAFYRARVNVTLQALATQHYGSSEPPLIYPNMLWFDSGSGTVKLRDPTNTACRPSPPTIPASSALSASSATASSNARASSCSAASTC